MSQRILNIDETDYFGVWKRTENRLMQEKDVFSLQNRRICPPFSCRPLVIPNDIFWLSLYRFYSKWVNYGAEIEITFRL
jgi:hypothetical protein